jgi:hypothetical protein
MTALLGLDLSTRAAAAVAVPLDWGGDWERVKWELSGEALERKAAESSRIDRCDRIARGIVRFARENGVTEAWIEAYAFNQREAAHWLGELGGIVRLELLRAGVAVRSANMSTARKLVLGKLPKAKRFLAEGEPYVAPK